MLGIRGTLLPLLLASSIASVRSAAESHTVHFENHCGYGTPVLIKGANVLSNGSDYTSTGPLTSAIAYLQEYSQNGTARCGFNGENCPLLELSLQNANPASPGSGSSADISLITPHTFTEATGFWYPSCNDTGSFCGSADCNATFAFHNSDDNEAQRYCGADNAGIVLSFCDTAAC